MRRHVVRDGALCSCRPPRARLHAARPLRTPSLVRSRLHAMIPVGGGRRFLLLLVLASGLLFFLFAASLRSSPRVSSLAGAPPQLPPSPAPVVGHVIAPKLGNETIKAELGRAAWKLLHTTFARFPDQPTADESAALESYIRLFQRLYPCGECAEHFGLLLEQFPPQVSSRSAAAAWGCHVHNEVNKRLRKELFDCSNIGDFYDCGCADGDEEGENPSVAAAAAAVAVASPKPEMSEERKAKLAGDTGRDVDEDLLSGKRPLGVAHEG
ncbi:ERV/ALR sulfhydryl oxidase domain-containing protein [Lineolata rhizophorae]|uniref:Sulfhydryl oxidase n=1 Tax=Lineolata rhizophorae TaxID=578093 RepID=A0A6A6NYE7_9PEZI|nr:ERV/ALR sulfhydryl oxidase domain-containing protein [Lineolata rhizophorae]